MPSTARILRSSLLVWVLICFVLRPGSRSVKRQTQANDVISEDSAIEASGVYMSLRGTRKTVVKCFTYDSHISLQCRRKYPSTRSTYQLIYLLLISLTCSSRHAMAPQRLRVAHEDSRSDASSTREKHTASALLPVAVKGRRNVSSSVNVGSSLKDVTLVPSTSEDPNGQQGGADTAGGVRCLLDIRHFEHGLICILHMVSTDALV